MTLHQMFSHSFLLCIHQDPLIATDDRAGMNANEKQIISNFFMILSSCKPLFQEQFCFFQALYKKA